MDNVIAITSSSIAISYTTHVIFMVFVKYLLLKKLYWENYARIIAFCYYTTLFCNLNKIDRKYIKNQKISVLIMIRSSK